MHPSKPALAVALAALALPAAAQTGPFADGEILVRGNLVAFDYALWRVDPVTGDAATLVTGLYPNYSKSGWMAYDPWRDAVFAYSAWAPVGIFSARLWLYRADGSVTQLGYTGEKLTDLAPVGDGRVYLRRDGVLHVLDAANQLALVPGADGLPVTLAAEHLHYHAPTNSLIGATRTGIAAPCSGLHRIVVHRLPLAPDGGALSAPPSCSSWLHGAGGAPIGLDPLPDGGLLMTLTGGSSSSNDRLVRVDPFTLAVTAWAAPDYADLDGGVWSQTLGRAVVQEDQDDTLRAYLPGQSGEGLLLPVTAAIGENTTGWSSANALIDIEVAAGGCAGSVTVFGQGSAGSGGAVPLLGAGTCPEVGGVLQLTVGSAIGNATAVVALSTSTGSYPLFGGTGYLLPPLIATYSLALSGPSNASAIGFGAVSIPVPNDPVLAGLAVFAQAAVVDSAAMDGLALTAALGLTLG